MDSHLFRLAGAELLRLLPGARLEKIHNPAEDVVVFGVYAQGRKLRLVLRSGGKDPCLFFSVHPFANPQRPSAAVMRLRKYAGDRRLGPGRADFSRRRLAFDLPGETPLFLILDLRLGPQIAAHLPEDFTESPLWPGADVLADLCGRPVPRHVQDSPWRIWSVLTPRLRETLAYLDLPEGRALLVDLEMGGDLFLYRDHQGGLRCFAWPLPEPLARDEQLAPVSFEEALAGAPDTEFAAAFPVLTAVGLADGPRFFRDLRDLAAKVEEKPEQKEKKRRKRLLARLDAEEERLRAMVAGKDAALLLQTHLWRFAPDERLPEVGLDGGAGTVRIVLNPLLTVRENMEQMFRRAAKGERGLAMLDERRVAGPLPRPRGATEESAEAARTRLPNNVARFVSSDGYTLLRGKNAEGNRALLKLGAPHDYWLHVKDGPGAHVLIRRAHAADEVPARTLQEAAALAGLRSFRAGDDRAEVILAEVRRVHPIKGGPAGTVRVDGPSHTVLAQLDSGLEIRLAGA